VTYLNVDSDYFNPGLIEKGQMKKALNIPDNSKFLAEASTYPPSLGGSSIICNESSICNCGWNRRI
jgi:hypothetical protein